MKKIKRGSAFLLALILAASPVTLQAAPESENVQVEGGLEETEETTSLDEEQVDSEESVETEKTEEVPQNETALPETEQKEGMATENFEADEASNEIKSSDTTEVVEIPDPVLEQAIRSNLNLTEDEEITRKKMEEITYFYCWGNLGQQKIESLQGLEYAVNLNSLDVYDNNISDLTPLKDLKNLSTINLSYNKVSDITVLESLSALTYADLSNNPVEEDIFEKYVEPKDEEILLAETNPFYLKVQDPTDCKFYVGTSEKILFEIPEEQQDIAVVSKEDEGSFLKMKQAGEVTVTAKLGGAVKEFKVTIVGLEEPLDESEKTEEFANVENGALGGALYEGSIWNLNGASAEKVSGDKDIKNYISRKVYFFDKTDKETYEHAGIDENGTLWYWGKSSVDGGYTITEVADNVKALTNTGYLDDSGVYHFWTYSFEKEDSPEPKDSLTISDVVEVTDTYLRKSDGTYIANCVPQLNKAILKTESPVIQIAGKSVPYALEENGNVWASPTFDDWFLVTTGVRELSEGDREDLFLKQDGTVEPFGVKADKLLGSDFLLKGNTLYSINYGSTDIYMVAENVKDAAGRLYLTETGEAWYAPIGRDDPKPYKVMSSVDSISSSTEYTTGEERYQLVREDGSIWAMTIPGVPYKVFTKPWSDIDEDTGISGSIDSDEMGDLPGNIQLIVEAVKENMPEYAEQYESFQKEISNEFGPAAKNSIFDIKLMSNGEKVESSATVTIKIPVPEGFGSNLKILHQLENGKVEVLSHTIDDGKIVFQTNSFSLFAVVETKSGTEEPEDPDVPQNPEDPDVPQNPEDPDVPQNPEDPDVPQTPGDNSGANTENSGHTDQNGQDGNVVNTSKGTVNTEVKAAKTGDSSMMEVYMLTLAAGVAGIGVCIKRRRKNR